MYFCILFCGNCNSTYDMGNVAPRLCDWLCKNGHILVSDQSAAEVEIRLNGCPTSCLDETNPGGGGDRVISVSATNIDLSAPDEEALIQWIFGEIRRIAPCP